MRQARNAAARFTPEQIVANATQQLANIDASRVPQFISLRLSKLGIMLQMLQDHGQRPQLQLEFIMVLGE